MARVVVHLYGRAKDESARRLIEDYQARIDNRGISVKVHSEKSLSTEDYERLPVSYTHLTLPTNREV